MKKVVLFVFCIAISHHVFSQEFGVNTVGIITIGPNSSSLNVYGLELNPSVEYSITGNAITYSEVPLDINGNPTIAKSYSYDNPLYNYEGEIIIYYQDDELNGLDEGTLLLGIQDDFDVWGSYPSTVDTGANTVLYDFTSPINFKGVTASNDVPLSIDNLQDGLFEISLYPNPVSSKLFVKSEANLELELFDLLGKSILKTNSENIDLSHLQNTMYILNVTEIDSGKRSTYKIIKN